MSGALAKVAVFVLLPRPTTSGSEILFMRRQNTGHEDGHLGLPSGYVEPGEEWEDAAIRETRKETSVIIPKGKLELVHIQSNFVDEMSRNDYVNLYYLCPIYDNKVVWTGEPKIAEPRLCSELAWHDSRSRLNGELPADVISYVRAALESRTLNSTFHYPLRA